MNELKLKELNTRYERLLNTKSEPLLAMNTFAFIDYLKKEPLFSTFINWFDNHEDEAIDITNDNKDDYYLEFQTNPERYVISCWHWLKETILTKSDVCLNLYIEAFWLTSNNEKSISIYKDDNKTFSVRKEYSVFEKMQIFVTGTISPIVNHITDNLNQKIAIEHYIKRFTQRSFLSRRFEKAIPTSEKTLQNEFALYLFDQGFNFSKESEFGNGKSDFILLIEGAKYAIEIKYTKTTPSINNLNTFYNQLKDYMVRFQCQFGCLLFFNERNLEFKKEPDSHIIVENIRLKPVNPSNNKIETIYF